MARSVADPAVSHAPTKTVGLLVIPNFTTIGFASTIETLRMANMAARRDMFRTLIIGPGLEPVTASNGMRILPDCAMQDAPKLDILLVVGANPIVSHLSSRPLLNWLRKLAHEHVVLGGICTGSYWLARPGLLKGYRCTIHWEDIETLKDHFPGIIISNQLFELDRDRYTCSGGVASMDMTLQLIAREPGGREIAAHAAELLLCDRARSAQEQQRVPAIMEANLEEPVSLEELARLNEVSIRQLERLFHKHLQRTPSQYYLELRLARARSLLLRSESQVRDIALACGFVSAAHFSKCYSRLFGVSPIGDRKQVALH